MFHVEPWEAHLNRPIVLDPDCDETSRSLSRTHPASLNTVPPLDRPALPSRLKGPPLPESRLLNAEQVAAEILSNAQSAAWVRRNCWVGRYKPSHKTVLWREVDLRRAIARGERLTR